MLMYLYFVFRAKNTKYILMSNIFRQWAMAVQCRRTGFLVEMDCQFFPWV